MVRVAEEKSDAEGGEAREAFPSREENSHGRLQGAIHDWPQAGTVYQRPHYLRFVFERCDWTRRGHLLLRASL